ncbi:MAG: class I SAM-dependent methyltransferase [Candidatus Hodarchaeota archaeon]
MIDLMIPRSFLENLCCPSCLGSLITEDSDTEELQNGSLYCPKCNHNFNIKKGIPNLVIPEDIQEKDAIFSQQADDYGRYYDKLLKAAGILTFTWDVFNRKKHVQNLAIKEGDCVLDISTGTGLNLFPIRKIIGETGTLVGLDLSLGMLSITRKKILKKKVRNLQLHRANACYLPYKDNTFDGVMHSGGINTFSDKTRAIREMLRVVKTGESIVISDEGLSPKRRRTRYGKLLIQMNSLYLSSPPINHIPQKIPYNLKYIWGETFYLLSLTKPKILH